MDERNPLMKSILHAFTGLIALLLLFVGCGKEAGDREYQKALYSPYNRWHHDQ